LEWGKGGVIDEKSERRIRFAFVSSAASTSLVILSGDFLRFVAFLFVSAAAAAASNAACNFFRAALALCLFETFFPRAI